MTKTVLNMTLRSFPIVRAVVIAARYHKSADCYERRSGLLPCGEANEGTKGLTLSAAR